MENEYLYLTWVAFIVCVLAIAPAFAQTNTTSQDDASIIHLQTAILKTFVLIQGIYAWQKKE